MREVRYKYKTHCDFVNFASEHVFNGMIHGLMHGHSKDRDNTPPVIVVDVTARSAMDYAFGITQRSTDFIFVGMTELTTLRDPRIADTKTAYIILSPNLISLPKYMLKEYLPDVLAIERLEILRICGFGKTFRQYKEFLFDGLYEYWREANAPDWLHATYKVEQFENQEEPITESNLPLMVPMSRSRLNNTLAGPFHVSDFAPDCQPNFYGKVEGRLTVGSDFRACSTKQLYDALQDYHERILKELRNSNGAYEMPIFLVDGRLHKRIFFEVILRDKKDSLEFSI